MNNLEKLEETYSINLKIIKDSLFRNKELKYLCIYSRLGIENTDLYKDEFCTKFYILYDKDCKVIREHYAHISRRVSCQRIIIEI